MCYKIAGLILNCHNHSFEYLQVNVIVKKKGDEYGVWKQRELKNWEVAEKEMELV